MELEAADVTPGLTAELSTPLGLSLRHLWQLVHGRSSGLVLHPFHKGNKAQHIVRLQPQPTRQPIVAHDVAPVVRGSGQRDLPRAVG